MTNYQKALFEFLEFIPVRDHDEAEERFKTTIISRMAVLKDVCAEFTQEFTRSIRS